MTSRAERAARELAAIARQRRELCHRMRDIGDSMDYAKLLEMRSWGTRAAERDYREFRVIPAQHRRPRPSVALSPVTPAIRSATVRKSAPADDLHFRTNAEYLAWAREVKRKLTSYR